MKNDYSFKLVAAIVIAGVFVAFISPSRALHPSVPAKAEVVAPAHQAE